MRPTRKPVRFTAKIHKLGINPCVEVPQRVTAHFGQRGYVPVEGTLEGRPIRATLVPKGGGRHRLFINGEMRKTAGVDTGDTVRLVLKLDTKSRDIATPRDLSRALRATNGARPAFEELSPSRRKEILVWVLDAKRPETRERRIEKVIQHLVQGPS